MSEHLQRALLWFPAEIRDHPLVGFGHSVVSADKSRGSYSHFEAWATLVFTARWEYGRKEKRGLVIELERGELVASRRWLAETFNWNDKKVRWFLHALQDDGLILVKQAEHISANVVYINDYDAYNPLQILPEEVVNCDGNLDEAFRSVRRARRGLNAMSDVAAQIYKRQQIPFPLRKAVYERDGYICLGCGRKTHLSCDHIIAVTSGGETSLENLQTLCLPCNLKKGAKNGSAVA